MARKKKDSGGGGGSWLDTYADMVTLLLTFFVMLFSMSAVEETKWEALVRSFTHPGSDTDQIVVAPEGDGADIGSNKGHPPETTGNGTADTESDKLDFETLFEYLEEFVKQNNLEGQVEVSEGESSVYIRFSNSIFFNADSYALRPDSHETMAFLGDALKQVEEELLTVMIAGHTATVDGPYRVSARMLSSQRAANVAIYFEDNSKLSSKKLLANGYAGDYPVATNDTAEGREKNRRVEFLILSNKADLSNKEIIEYVLKGTYDPVKYPAKGAVDDIVLPDGVSGKTPVAMTESTPPVSTQPPASTPDTEGTGSAPPVSEPPKETG